MKEASHEDKGIKTAKLNTRPALYIRYIALKNA